MTNKPTPVIGIDFGGTSVKLAVVRGETLLTGVYRIPTQEFDNPEQLIEYADHALYCAKQAGKTRLMIYRPSGAGMREDCADAVTPAR